MQYPIIGLRTLEQWAFLLLQGAPSDLRKANPNPSQLSCTVECTTLIIHGEGRLFPLG